MDFTAKELELIKTLQKLNRVRSCQHEKHVEQEMTEQVKTLSTQLCLTDERWGQIEQVVYQ